MKQVIFFEILKKLKSKPALAKKLKIFVVAGLVGFVLLGGLAIWAGVNAVKYVAVSANQAISSSTAQEQIQTAKTSLQQIQFQPANCWKKALSLLGVQPWLEKTAFDNLRNLKLACLAAKPTICDGNDCSKNQKGERYDSGKI